MLLKKIFIVRYKNKDMIKKAHMITFISPIFRLYYYGYNGFIFNDKNGNPKFIKADPYLRIMGHVDCERLCCFDVKDDMVKYIVVLNNSNPYVDTLELFIIKTFRLVVIINIGGVLLWNILSTMMF